MSLCTWAWASEHEDWQVFASLVYSCVEKMSLLGLMCTGTPELRVFDLVRMASPAENRITLDFEPGPSDPNSIHAI